MSYELNKENEEETLCKHEITGLKSSDINVQLQQ